MTATVDWDRVAQYVRARRQHLGIKQVASKVSPATWTNIENAKQESYKPFTLATIDRELRWPPGTVLHIGAGGEPPESDDDLAARVAIIERQLAELMMLVRQLPGIPQDGLG